MGFHVCTADVKNESTFPVANCAGCSVNGTGNDTVTHLVTTPVKPMLEMFKNKVPIDIGSNVNISKDIIVCPYTSSGANGDAVTVKIVDASPAKCTLGQMASYGVSFFRLVHVCFCVFCVFQFNLVSCVVSSSVA